MSEQHQVQYGNTTIVYALAFAPRTTLEIRVQPDLRVMVTAPLETAPDAVAAKVRQRAAWILRQQRELAQYLPAAPPRQYLSGETHRYLGRQYRLKVVVDTHEEVKLTRGRLYVWASDPTNTERVQELIEAWYRVQATRVFRERLMALLPRFKHLGIQAPQVEIKLLQARWGSCTGTGTITLNLRLMQVSKHHIDYVIVHELCHLVEHNHSRRFYLLLEQLMPDWRERRRQLNESEVYPSRTRSVGDAGADDDAV